MRHKYGIRTLLIACVLVASYLSVYRALLSPDIVLTASAGGVGVGHRNPSFQFAAPVLKLAFWPLTALDRRVRPTYWNDYTTLEDVLAEKDYPWGYVGFVDGHRTSLCLYANTNNDVDCALTVLRESPHIRSLRVNGEFFTDAHLQALQDVRTFHSVELLSTDVSREAVMEFRRSSPKTDVTCIAVSAGTSTVY